MKNAFRSIFAIVEEFCGVLLPWLRGARLYGESFELEAQIDIAKKRKELIPE